MRLQALVSLVAWFSIIVSAHAQTFVEGRIETDTVWRISGNPFVLTGDVEVAGGATLTIEGGVRVEGMAGTRLIIGGDADGDIGTLQAFGEEFARVDLRAHDPDQPWGGVLFTPNARDAEFSIAEEFLDGSIIRFAYVWQAEAPISMIDSTPYFESVIVVGPQDPFGLGISAELRPTMKQVRMRSVEVSGSTGFGLGIRGGAGHLLEDCTFEENGQGAFINSLVADPSSVPRDRIVRCTFVRNGIGGGPSSSGGGMSYAGPQADFVDCRFYFNSADFDAGGLNGLAYGQTTRISGCEFVGNLAGRSGGAMDFNADLIIEDCVFMDNLAERSAGGYLGFDDRTLTMRRCEFVDNRAGRGGAMTLSFGVVDVEDCDFEGNSSTTDGGAVRFFRGESDITFTNNRFIQNITAGAGGAVGFIDSDDHDSVVFVGNTFEGNIARLGGAVYTTNIDDDVSLFSFAGSNGLVNTFTNNTAQLGDDIYHASPVDIDATGVCWGTSVPLAIGGRIYDGRDEPGLGIVWFDPVAPDCDGCRADLDGDGALTLFDYLAFSGLFGLGDLQADFDGDGVLTIFDFLLFQTEFEAGCDG
ncbi:MAG: right-handed parallel beta-helix repeat-containing protein [Phycisphaerales bacterium]